MTQPDTSVVLDVQASLEQLTMDELEELLRAVNEEITRRQEQPR